MRSHDDIEPEGERAIDELLDAASEEVDDEDVVRPPFAVVLARARRIDPTFGRAASVSRPPPMHAVEADDLAAELAPFVAAARAEAERDVAEVEDHAPPGLPRPGGIRITRWVAVTGMLAAAAALVLLWSVLDVEHARRALAQREGSQAMDQVDAERRVLEAETGGEAPSLGRAPRGRGVGPRAESSPADGAVLPDEAAPLEPIAIPPTIPEEAAALESPTVEVPPPSTAPPPPRAARDTADAKLEGLRRLDRTASERLAAGDVEGAEAAYRALVRRGGRSGLVELAYGDLFMLAHRRGDSQAQGALWREYLRKFPRGRFADDATAGLCRIAKGDEAQACWERYLDEFPTGAYHRQAERIRDRE